MTLQLAIAVVALLLAAVSVRNALAAAAPKAAPASAIDRPPPGAGALVEPHAPQPRAGAPEVIVETPGWWRPIEAQVWAPGHGEPAVILAGGDADARRATPLAAEEPPPDRPRQVRRARP